MEETKRKRGRPRTPVGPCDVSGCSNKSHCRGMCIMHYDRYRRYGDPGEVQPRQNNLASLDRVITRLLGFSKNSRTTKKIRKLREFIRQENNLYE